MTTAWGPSESSLRRDSFNDLVRHKTVKKTNVPLLLMKANVMSRTAMLSFPAVGDYTRSIKSLQRVHSATGSLTGSLRNRSCSLSSVGLKSLRFSGSSQDGQGSIRQGTPVTQQRKDSVSDHRHGYMPPEAGYIERKGSVKISRWLQSQVDELYEKMDENADGRLTKFEAQKFFHQFGKLGWGVIWELFFKGDWITDLSRAKDSLLNDHISESTIFAEVFYFYIYFKYYFPTIWKKAQIPRKISSCAMFSEVDENGDGEILPSEWRNFWEQVRGNGYSEEDIAEELQQLMRGGVWVDFLDDRSVSVNSRSAPQKEKRMQQ